MRLVKIVLALVLALALIPLGILGFGYFNSHSKFFRDSIRISGTGSMYPTFPRGEGTDSATLSHQTVATVSMHRFPGGLNLFGYSLFTNKLDRGDVVSFENAQTDKLSEAKSGTATGFVKRIIALPGDRLEIRDGFVKLNDQTQIEPYTATARSTFGGQYLPDCQLLTVPDDSVFVMGDNRKSSSDSRQELGLVQISDIDHFLPLPEQTPYAQNWRDATADSSQSLKPVLDKQEFLKLLNVKRQTAGLPLLTYQPKLETSSGIRADAMLKFNDLSFTATKSGITMATAMDRAGYSNIVWGEAPTLGYYTASELLENFFEFPSSQKFLLNPDFQETGITAKIGSLHGCPVQIVVQHLAGYKPPNYSESTISGWSKVLDGLKSAYPSWTQLKTYPGFYRQHQSEIDELLSLFSSRITHLQAIVDRMKSNQWLTKDEDKWAKEDESQAKRMTDLISKLNN